MSQINFLCALLLSNYCFSMQQSLLSSSDSPTWDLENQVELSNIRSTNSPSLLQKKQFFKQELKLYTTEVVIASLYLVGGLPFFSDDIREAADLSASSIWLVDSLISLGSTVRNFYHFRRCTK